MSLYGLTLNVASGISPLLGGILSDQFGPGAWLEPRYLDFWLRLILASSPNQL